MISSDKSSGLTSAVAEQAKIGQSDFDGVSGTPRGPLHHEPHGEKEPSGSLESTLPFSDVPGDSKPGSALPAKLR